MTKLKKKHIGIGQSKQTKNKKKVAQEVQKKNSDPIIQTKTLTWKP